MKLDTAIQSTQRAVAMAHAVPDMRLPEIGETAARPIAAPKVVITVKIAAATTDPARIAAQSTYATFARPRAGAGIVVITSTSDMI
jgi:hypothetical protein